MEKTKLWEFVNYLCLAGLIIGQITIGFIFYIGQITYIVTDVLLVIRSFATHCPTSEKVKNIALTAIAVGVIIVKIFIG